MQMAAAPPADTPCGPVARSPALLRLFGRAAPDQTLLRFLLRAQPWRLPARPARRRATQPRNLLRHPAAHYSSTVDRELVRFANLESRFDKPNVRRPEVFLPVRLARRFVSGTASVARNRSISGHSVDSRTSRS